MHIVQPSFEIVDCNNVMKTIELAARKCYKSEDKICEGSDVKIIGKILEPKFGIKHESVLEHGVISVVLVNDRGVSHEEVRHRHCAFSQESTRYCNYSKDKYGNEITVIDPFFFDPHEPCDSITIPDMSFALSAEQGRTVPVLSGGQPAFMNSFDVWFLTCLWAEWGYNTLTQHFKRSAQEARSVLPNSLKTEIAITANVREWRHILALRTNRDAHPQIRQVMVPLAHAFAARWPALFEEFLSVTHEKPAEQIFSSSVNT